MNDPERQPTPRRWWVLFRDREAGDRGHWWDWFTRPGFRHCFAMTELTPGQVLLVDPATGGVHIELLSSRPDKILIACRDKGYRVFVAKAQRGVDTPRPIKRGFGVTCASYLAYTLALDGRPITPRQLHKLLIATGARELWSERRSPEIADTEQGKLQPDPQVDGGQGAV